MNFLTDMTPTPFLAAVQADIDWQAVGANENPYSVTGNFEAYTAYNSRFDQIREEWEDLTRSAA